MLSLTHMFDTLLMLGSVLHGSRTVLLLFPRHEFVGRLGWLADHVLPVALSEGHVTLESLSLTEPFVGPYLSLYPALCSQ